MSTTPKPPTSPSRLTTRERSNNSGGASRPTTRAATVRPPSPTRSLEPGHIHYRIAGGILKGVQDRAKEAGIELDVGEIPTQDIVTAADKANPDRLVHIVARIVARTGDRFKVTRKLSRHLEGQDKRSGLLSDVAAAALELYRRNPEAIENLGKQAAQDFKTRRAQRTVAKNNPTQNGGMTTHA